jgi:hypothetical protein
MIRKLRAKMLNEIPKRKDNSPVQDELHFSYKVADSTELTEEQAQRLSVLHHLLGEEPCRAYDHVLLGDILMGKGIQERARV